MYRTKMKTFIHANNKKVGFKQGKYQMQFISPSPSLVYGRL
jgi:hypothetical protein